ncbi:hypothetical protein EH31_12220 [Erythrobacter longus]|uniref:Cyclase n=1 Tax=Erythrobacter longus TaxID=1044 RepID=A0A074M9F8_ERYLO|nr:hypothetical protein [Erythrobacter longus]KEO89405.1 hypothetical protein EH31_12220 [Erythrobacter longus]
MQRVVELTTTLDCAPDEAWTYVRTSALLDYIAAPLIRFVPRGGKRFPPDWTVGEHRALMLLFGIIPIGWQAIVISFPEPDGEVRTLRDNGYGPMIKRWDHWIEIAPDTGGTATRYTDRVTVDAGFLTPLVAGFARVFYAHRQRRWRSLVAKGFAPLKR